ncbi:DUF3263 domain-containing protein [Sanguibacter antarcticus]|uniref:Uncharacterized protein DUF3263 n=1 Tax=Sanguibacter antarcticus TaxID=372484 RepID=A0A2A9E9Q5_9MICO|nr:DUF3263 domain-containing protein [Sanguibacter antarcticus]PFG35291.1 uncharacterized protein DUF3263 [Sanguibacter antarcticus]
MIEAVVEPARSPEATRAESAGSEALPAEEAATAPDLSERDVAILGFEKQWWKYAGAKEQAVRELFNLSATQYYQILNALIDTPEALAAEPMLVKRLRRMRSTRQRERTERRAQG